jgi:hypothetical protein|tara:strand:+ start:120 stop:311 length:192 start_codon:yes stop_codon:yes gene_type:complete
MKYQIQVYIWKNGEGEWKSIHPTGGEPYEYTDKREAFNMLSMCYPDDVNFGNLNKTVRLKELK